MTSSSLEIPMTLTEASQVTSKIKLLLTTITETTEKIFVLIDKAKSGDAWKVLGYDSWPAYVKAEFADSMAGLARAERIGITEKLSETGLSSRAIAPVVGVSDRQVRSDLQVGSDFPPADNVVGLDGKNYIGRNGKPTAAGMIDLAGAVPPPVKQKLRRNPLPDRYWRAVYDLEKAAQRVANLHADDRFPHLREQLREKNWREVTAIESLVMTIGHDLDDVANKCECCDARILPNRDLASKCQEECADEA
jgi:hypothetical protein